MFYDHFETFSCTGPSLCEEKAALKDKVIWESFIAVYSKIFVEICLKFFDMYYDSTSRIYTHENLNVQKAFNNIKKRH